MKAAGSSMAKSEAITRSVQAIDNAAVLSRELRALANPEHAAILQRFFKTGPGQYGEGDVFVGLKVPVIRALVRQCRAMPPKEALKLVRSAIHEERLAGLLIWVQACERGDGRVRQQVFRLYLRNTRHINNWDLVDLSAPQIVGQQMDPETPESAALLERLAQSPWLWDRRIAVLATLAWIRAGRFGPTLDLCRRLLTDRHDLMHKACGWMLREVGKRDQQTLRQFLDRHARKMPRTMLRYSLEHFSATERAKFMAR